MKKTWIFFKLRILQLKSDKTALFFCYVFPVLLLLGIGYPLQLQSDPKIMLHYTDEVNNAESRVLLEKLAAHKLVDLRPYEGLQVSPYKAVEENDIARYLRIAKPDYSSLTTKEYEVLGGVESSLSAGKNLAIHYSKNDIDENRIENAALLGVIEQIISSDETHVHEHTLESDRFTSYLVTLLPGLIGLTLMIIGFNGFGGVLIEEENYGLFKNIKTIDVSPIPFLAGLFLSRLLVSYSVAIALCIISIFVFNIEYTFNYFLLALVVTLGSIAFLGVGLVIATLSPSISSFNGIVNFVQMPFIVLGGVFFSISLFPDWVQTISLMVPLTHMNTAIQKILFESMSFNDLAGIGVEMSVLAGWCVASIVFARYRFRW